MRNALALGSTPLSERSGVLPLSTDPCSPPSTRSSSKRRLSGPAWPTPPQQQRDPPLTQSRSSGHLVDSMRASTFNHHHGKWTHPYLPHLEAERSRADGSHAQQHEESPSPISSDSELVGHDGLHKTPRMFHLHGSSASQSRTCAHHNQSLDNSPPHHSSSVVRTATSSDFAFTPSASPFLGPMRTLNIHSTTPSRAPSPIFLPPNSMGHGDEASGMHSRTVGMAYGSPPLTPNSFVHRKQHWRDGSSSHGYGSVSSQLPTPQLSSGPSSSGSNPGSFISPHLQHQLGGTAGGSGTPSTSGSRAPSPIHWGHRPSPPSSASTNSFHHASNNNNSHTHHLAHSVHAAFGMTPIHSHPPSRRSSPPLPPLSMPRNTSWSASSGSGSWQGLPSNQHQHSHHPPHHPLYPMHNYQHHRDANPSLPGSRSGSPPIRLPPLKMLPNINGSTATTSNLAPSMENPTENPSDSISRITDQQQMVGVKMEKVELPGFSEFEAATRGTGATGDLSSSAPTATGADARMSIDFVR